MHVDPTHRKLPGENHAHGAPEQSEKHRATALIRDQLLNVVTFAGVLDFLASQAVEVSAKAGSGHFLAAPDLAKPKGQPHHIAKGPEGRPAEYPRDDHSGRQIVHTLMNWCTRSKPSFCCGIETRQDPSAGPARDDLWRASDVRMKN